MLIYKKGFLGICKIEEHHRNLHFSAPYMPHQTVLRERTVKYVKRILPPYLKNNYSDDTWRILSAVAQERQTKKLWPFSTWVTTVYWVLLNKRLDNYSLCAVIIIE